ncbi:hypothetical protein AC1031_002781 [Aphanomyces cochlioides]|nr:hypothetical protein AC1031_002781 [Aphanomyces cochlioides]
MAEASHENAIDKTSTRRTFTAGDDIILLMAVNNAQVWACAPRTVMKVWDGIADKVNGTPNVTVAGKNGPAYKTRFEGMMKSFLASESKSRRQSGTTEEYNTKDQLLTDIHQQMQDHTEEQDKNKQVNKRRVDALEASGATMRRKAMEESESSTSSDVSSLSSSNHVYNLIIGRATETAKKKRQTKRTKREQLSAMMDSIASAVGSMEAPPDSSSMLLDYLKHRDAQEAEREERRIALENAREKRNQDFLLAIINSLPR